MRQPILMSAFLALVSALATSAQQPTAAQVAVDLKEIGYPQEACNYEGKTQIEFLDSTRLLVSFPFHSSPCNGQAQFSEKWRAAVVDASGKTLHTLDFELGQQRQVLNWHHLVRGLLFAAPTQSMASPTSRETQ